MTDPGPPRNPHGPTSRSGLVLVGLITLAWGLHWPLIKVGLSEIPPLTFRGTAVIFGGLALLVYAAWRNERIWPRRREAAALVWTSMCNVAIWQVLTAYALQIMPAGRGVVLAYTMPIWGVLLGAIFLHERIDRARLIALVLGTSGMGLLIGDDLLVVGRAPLGSVMILGAAFIWAVGTVSTKGFQWTVSLASMAGWQLVIAAFPMLLGGILFERDQWIIPSAGPLFALVYNILVASILAYLVWFRLLTLYPAGIASISVLLIPVVGLFSGAMILGEPIGPAEIVALILVVGALAAAHQPWRSARSPDT